MDVRWSFARGLVFAAGLGSLLTGCPSKGPPPPKLAWRLYQCSGSECYIAAIFTSEEACHEFELRTWSQCDPEAFRRGSIRCDLMDLGPEFQATTRCTKEHLVWADLKDGPRWSFRVQSPRR